VEAIAPGRGPDRLSADRSVHPRAYHGAPLWLYDAAVDALSPAMIIRVSGARVPPPASEISCKSALSCWSPSEVGAGNTPELPPNSGITKALRVVRRRPRASPDEHSCGARQRPRRSRGTSRALPARTRASRDCRAASARVASPARARHTPRLTWRSCGRESQGPQGARMTSLCP
jgi:hypothetical protein